MTLLLADGFESGATGWTISNASISTGRFGNGVVGLTSALAWIGYGPVNNPGPVIFGFAYKATSSSGEIAKICWTIGTIQMGLARGSAGEIYAWRASTSNILGTSAAGVLPSGAWSYIECKTMIHDTTGSVVVRVNGLEVLNIINVDTHQSDTATGVLALGSSGSPAGAAWDDVYLCDGSGSVNNDFLGELTVEHLRPSSNVTSQWVGSDADSTNNWDLVDESGAYNSADYVATSTIGNRDIYLPTTSSRPVSAPVRGVIVSAIAQKTDAGTRTAKLVIKEGPSGTERLSAELGLPTSFGELRALWNRKADGSAWTVADINTLRFGIEVVS